LLIREFGFWGLPSYRRLGERYHCSHTTIKKDIHKIVETLDPRELDKGFTEFLEANKKIQIEMRKVLRKGSVEQKFKASHIILQNEHGFTDLLEKYGKKPIVADKFEVGILGATFNLIEKSVEEIKNAKSDHKPETKGDAESLRG